MTRAILPFRLGFVLLLAATQGCCAIAGLFGCGPGEPLVALSYDSPRACLTTFLAAIRFSDARRVYESLDEGYKAELGIDGLAFEVAWERLKNEVPAIYLAGRAEVLRATRVGPRVWRYELEVYGEGFEVDCAARAYREFGAASDAASDEVDTFGAYVGEAPFALDPEEGRLSSSHSDERLVGLGQDDLAFYRAGLAWKISRFRPRAAPQPEHDGERR